MKLENQISLITMNQKQQSQPHGIFEIRLIVCQMFYDRQLAKLSLIEILLVWPILQLKYIFILYTSHNVQCGADSSNSFYRSKTILPWLP